jgi:hypothetical protein
MAKWEYTFVSHNEESLEHINKLGKEGWKIISESEHDYTLSRKIKSQKERKKMLPFTFCSGESIQKDNEILIPPGCMERL